MQEPGAWAVPFTDSICADATLTGGKPVGVITQPDFTWLATGRLFPELPLPELKSAALDFLDEEAGRLEGTRRDTATILRFIARRIREIAAYPPPPVLREIGPAYFKAGATQVRQYSPELSLRLLRVVQMLQPDREEISKRIAQLERDLADSDG